MHEPTGSERLEEALLLLGVAGFTVAGATRLKEVLGSETAIFGASRSDLREAGFAPALTRHILGIRQRGEHLNEREAAAAKGIKTLVYGSSTYPHEIMDIPAAPLVLFMRGRLPEKVPALLAIVGSRRCTPEGRRLSHAFGANMAERGVPVVSGMARGIDEAAIRGTLAKGGFPIGVLGCGLDVVYPSESALLFGETSEHGALLTEFPLGTSPLKQNFPRRNRIISGLSDGVLVIEASKKSGSLITVDHALSQNRSVLAVPGPVGPASFRGTNMLIRDGACVVLEDEDIAAALSLPPMKKAEPVMKPDPARDPVKKSILEICNHEAVTLEGLARRTEMTFDDLIRLVSSLETEGCLKRISGGRFMVMD